MPRQSTIPIEPGKRFGKLIVVERIAGKKPTSWKCQCDCGKCRVVNSRKLSYGLTVSCGCVRSPVLGGAGQRFGRLVLVRKVRKNGANRRIWECLCDCGKTCEVSIVALRRGNNRSCGCLFRDSIVTHGMKGTKEYAAWNAMKERCLNPNSKYFRLYGGRGITICQEWINSFETFLADVGLSPIDIGTPQTGRSEYSIHRIDNNKGYEPGNVKWATQKEQMTATSKTTNITWNGETLCLSAWGNRLGVSDTEIRYRLKKGWPPERIFTTPFHWAKRRKKSL